MSLQEESQLPRVPSLTQYCYRYINSHLDAILSLGDTPYSLCEPILRSCSAEQLLALEKNSTHLENEDQAVWQALCFRDFPRSKAQYEDSEFSEPDCWRKQYFVCRGSEEKRLEEIGTRIRSRREEADQEKKDRQVIYTDRLPPAKRARFNNPGTSKPKTLIEKTRAESIKIQRLVYGPSMLPPMSTKAVKPRLVSPPKAKTTTLQTPSSKNSAVSSRSSAIERNSLTPSPPKPLAQPSAGGHGTPKKDPMATLFMPKHRAHSQLPTEPPLTLRRK